MSEIFFIYVIMIAVSFWGIFTDKKNRFFYASLFFVGILGVVVCAVDIEPSDKDTISLSAPCGLLMSALGINLLRGFNGCTKKVVARCTGYQVHRVKGIPCFYPVFRYTYKGKTFISQSLVNYLEADYNALFDKGEEITIYINPKKPDLCVDKRKLPYARAFFVLSLGVFLLVISGFIIL